MRILDRLVPDEPLFPYDPETVPTYPERLPPVVRNWCFVSIAMNLVTLAVGTLVFRNLAPAISFLMFTLGPLYLLFFWRGLIKTTNGNLEKIERQTVVPRLMPYPSVEWLFIFTLTGASAMFVSVLVPMA